MTTIPPLNQLPHENAENFPLMSEEAFECLLDDVEQRNLPLVICRGGQPTHVLLPYAFWERIKPKE